MKSDVHFDPALRLVAERLVCIRGGRVVFEGLSFSVAGGEALVVTGPNGAGKSSLIRQIAGLVEVTEGKLALDGGETDAVLSEQAHYIGHLDALKPSMSVRETAAFWADFFEGGNVGEALEAFDLAALADLPVAYLSAGQRRRLALSRLLVAPRPLWLLDEPSVALDAASLARLVALMEAHLARGGIVVAATHQPLGLARTTALDLTSVRRRTVAA
jgi:heme exporter protein A